MINIYFVYCCNIQIRAVTFFSVYFLKTQIPIFFSRQQFSLTIARAFCGHDDCLWSVRALSLSRRRTRTLSVSCAAAPAVSGRAAFYRRRTTSFVYCRVPSRLVFRVRHSHFFSFCPPPLVPALVFSRSSGFFLGNFQVYRIGLEFFTGSSRIYNITLNYCHSHRYSPSHTYRKKQKGRKKKRCK